MKLRVTIGVWLIACGGVTIAAAQDAPLIARAQRVSAASLDSTMPAVPFEQWLTTITALPASGRHWEVNDCGEGGDGRAAPTCVEAILDLALDTAAHASLIVADLDGAPGTVAIFMLYAVARDSIITFKRLPQWVAYVQRRAR